VSLITKIKKAIADYAIRKEVTLINKIKLDKEALFRYLTLDVPKKLNREEIKNILKAVEAQGHINQHNLSVWKKIYDKLGVIYPINN
jgi:hypothetical protein